MSNSSPSQIISLPKGGGAQHGLGEKFSPDLHTGTGNFTVPIALPPGRNGFQPQLNLVYSTGNGNGAFGLGWSLSVPGVSRKTTKGVPIYDDVKDVFILSGAEDLVPVPGASIGSQRYRPRTEGLFALIDHVRDDDNNYWQVRSKDGLVSFYGTARPSVAPTAWQDPAIISKPSHTSGIFAWKLTETRDPFGNRILYEYERDKGVDGSHEWDQVYLKRILYVDYLDLASKPQFLVSVSFNYEIRDHDPFSDYRPGFEIRTRKRCTNIEIRTHAEKERLTRTYNFVYLDQRSDIPSLESTLPLNRVSLLSQIHVVGHDDEQPVEADRMQRLPPLEFRYSRFEPESRDFFPITGRDLPPASLAHSDYELVDLFGNGLPDIFEMNGTVRYWRNLGDGTFDLPRSMNDAPAGLMLADSGVQLIDADGDGRTDLLVTKSGLSGYFPLRFGGFWDRLSFKKYDVAPSFNLEDPEVKLVDLNGDGVTDAIRSGTRLECFFNDPQKGWTGTKWVERQSIDVFPDVNFSDPRVKWADMSGDGLQDIALVYEGNVEYYPNLGWGDWGKPIHMEHSPHFPYGYDPKRILVGDVDGDGLADIVYVDNNKVTLWINQSGNAWSNPIEIHGTPPVSDIDAVRLADMQACGVSGVLWSTDFSGLSPKNMFFLDFTGGVKPYLLNEMDNHIGALTKVGYAPSTRFYLEDEKKLENRWKTPLPFPVQVVGKVEVIDHFSRSKHTTEYFYHHGYWDGAEREFRGFGRVDQVDTEDFATYNASGLHGEDAEFTQVSGQHFCPPTLTKTWFHQGPVGDEFGPWEELDRSDEYWSGDPQLLKHTETVNQFLQTWDQTPTSRRAKRDALRALRGSVLRTELYALDGSEREDKPYTVTESSYGLAEFEAPSVGEEQGSHIFFPHVISQRTTQWERGDDPMTQFTFTDYVDEDRKFDRYGRSHRQTSVASPRGWRTPTDISKEYLTTRVTKVYAQPADVEKTYIVDRVAKSTSFEIRNSVGRTVGQIRDLEDTSSDLAIIGQTLSFYDGAAFVGLAYKQIGDYGALVRTETLVLSEQIMTDAYGAERPPYLLPSGAVMWTGEYPNEFRDMLPSRAGYTHHPSDAVYAEGYFVQSERRQYDFHGTLVSKRGLVTTQRPPLGQADERDTKIEYDDYRLLSSSVTDPAGLKTFATYDYRVLLLSEVTDPNGNKNRVTFSPLGLLESTFVQGKTSTEGDQDRPSMRMEYEFLAFDSPPRNHQPISVRTIRHTHHDNELDVLLPERDETITTVEYSDGFGRLLQTRTQGEEVRFGDERFGGGESVLPGKHSDGLGGDVVGRKNTDTFKPNVVVSGWQIYDNKGQVVEKYEPFFSEGWDYGQRDDSTTGQRAAMFYDPRGQLLRALSPDDSEQRVIYGVPGTIAAPDLAHPEHFEPTPWETYTYDGNDNAGHSHAAESAGYQHHWNTPASILIDAFGRTVESVQRNRGAPASPGDPSPPIEESRTRTSYDIRGNVLAITDPLGRLAFRHVYDFASKPLRIDSIDAGLRRIVLDAAGGIVEQRDGKGALILHAIDALHRPLLLWARDGGGQKLTLRERLEYGDGGSASQPTAARAASRAANRLGRLSRHFDEAGLLACEAYDFKGKLLEKTRQVVSDAAILAVFDGPPAAFKVEVFRVDWSDPAAVPLDARIFVSTSRYDALGRLKLVSYPEDVEHGRRLLRPRYNRAGALEQVALERLASGGGTVSDTFVERIAYNAKGQRVLIAYGNGIMTRHAHDPHTFRLTRLRTEQCSKPSELRYRHTGEPQQDLAYEYDLTGNIGTLRERTPGCGFKGSAQGQDALDRHFVYDALYRLLSANGRECDAPPPVPPGSAWGDLPRCTDITRTRKYEERYVYDTVGNILELHHSHFPADGSVQGFHRQFTIAANTNRLQMALFGSQPFSYVYDANGNMTQEATSRHFEWDHADRMRAYRTQTGTSEPSVHAHYLYDAGGQRVKKLVRKQGGQLEVTVYIDGIYEYQRIVRAGGVEENSTLHIMDSQSRIAQLRVGSPFAGDTTPPVKYHLGDHLGSSNLVLDGAGNAVNREEYTPYGETSFGSFSRKRYRFTGKERDDESGLNYHEARYYSPYLGRWMNCDPVAKATGTLNLFRYVLDNPLRFHDSGGEEEEDPGDATMAFLGVVYGTVQSLIPLGIGSLAPSPAPKSKGFETGRGRAQLAVGAAQTYIGLTEAGGGVAGAPETGGITLMAVPAGLVMTATGTANATAGSITLANAQNLKSSGSSKASSPASSTSGPTGKQPGAPAKDAAAGRNMSPDQAAYQKQVTGKPADQTYYVKGRSFDGYEPGKAGAPGKLVEAKHLGDEGRFAKAYENMKKGDFSDAKNLFDRGEKIIEQAQEQVRAAEGTGAQIEWRVSGEKATEALKQLFANDAQVAGKITVTHVPFKGQ